MALVGPVIVAAEPSSKALRPDAASAKAIHARPKALPVMAVMAPDAFTVKNVLLPNEAPINSSPWAVTDNADKTLVDAAYNRLPPAIVDNPVPPKPTAIVEAFQVPAESTPSVVMLV